MCIFSLLCNCKDETKDNALVIACCASCLCEKCFWTNFLSMWCVECVCFDTLSHSAVSGIKYLICADCEMGPIGYHDTREQPPRFLLAAERSQSVK